MKSRKQKKARLLTMDEFHTRPCEVDGEPALFHRWIDEDLAMLKVNCFVTQNERDAIVRGFRADGFCPAGCSVEVVRHTFALVEYLDGTVHKVTPEEVRFMKEEENYE